jgi:hypothetical protein
VTYEKSWVGTRWRWMGGMVWTVKEWDEINKSYILQSEVGLSMVGANFHSYDSWTRFDDTPAEAVTVGSLWKHKTGGNWAPFKVIGPGKTADSVEVWYTDTQPGWTFPAKKSEILECATRLPDEKTPAKPAAPTWEDRLKEEQEIAEWTALAFPSDRYLKEEQDDIRAWLASGGPPELSLSGAGGIACRMAGVAGKRVR